LFILGLILKTLIIFVLVLVIICGGAAAFMRFYKPVIITELYQFNTVLFDNIYRRVLTTGNIYPSDYAYIYTDASQKISDVYVKEGDPVNVGDMLISYDIEKEISDLQRRLDSVRLNEESARLNLQSIGLPAEGNELLQYSSDITSARHNVDQAVNYLANLDKKIEQQQKKIEQAQRDAERNEILIQAGNLPQAEFEASITALENEVLAMEELVQTRQAGEDTLKTREIQLDEAQQRLVNAQDRMGDEATIYKYRQQEVAIQLVSRQIDQIQADMSVLSEHSLSSVDGYVTAVNVRKGEIAVKGVILIEIAVTSDILAKADVTEFDAPLLSLGQEAEITTSGLPDSVYNAKITKIAANAVKKEKSSADEVVVPVELTLENADERLKPGYTVDINIYMDKRERVLAVPIQSVLLEESEKFLYVLNGDKLIKTPVTTGFYGDRSVEITSGAPLGTKYVIIPSEVKPLPDNWFTRSQSWLYEKLSWLMEYAEERLLDTRY